MKYLVTGNAGFLGSHLTEALQKDTENEVWGIDNLSGGMKENVNCHHFEIDLSNKKEVAATLELFKPDVLYHLAADATEGRSQFTPISSTQNGFMNYMNVLIPAIKAGVKKVVLFSSMSVYGDQYAPFDEDMPLKPVDIYAINKAACEEATKVLAKVHGFEWVIIRPHNVYGPRQSMTDPYRNVVTIFINRLLKGVPCYIYGDGEQERSFTYIDDFIPAVLKAENKPGHIFNIGPEEYFTINKLHDTVSKVMGSKLEPLYVDDRPLEVKKAFCTYDKARDMLDYKSTVTFEEGVKKTCEWCHKVGAKNFKYTDLELEKGAPITWRNKLI